MALQKRKIVLCSLSTNNDDVATSSDSFLGGARRVFSNRSDQDVLKESYDSTLDEGFIDREEPFFQHFLFAPDPPAQNYKTEQTQSDEVEDVEDDHNGVELHIDDSHERVRKRKRHSHNEDDSDEDDAWTPEKRYKKKLKTKNSGLRYLRTVEDHSEYSNSVPRKISPIKRTVKHSPQNTICNVERYSAKKSMSSPRSVPPNKDSSRITKVNSIKNKQQNHKTINKESPNYECALRTLCLKVDSETQECGVKQNAGRGTKQHMTLNNRVDRLELAIRPNLCVIHMWGQDPPALCILLQRFGVYPQNRTCPRCQHKMKLEENTNLLDGLMWICKTEVRHVNTKTGKFTSSECKKRSSFRKGSLFEKCKLPICTMLKLVHLFLGNMTWENIANELRMNEHFVKTWTTTFQNVLLAHLHEESVGIQLSTIGGPGKTVEIGEGHIASNKYLRRQEINQEHIVCGLEHGSGKYFILPVKDLSNKTIEPLIRKWIIPGATILHSGKDIYHFLSETGLYECVNRSLMSDNEDSEEDIFINAQMELPKFSQYSGSIAGCLATIIFLANCKSKKKIPFWEFLRLVVNVSIS